MNPDSECVLLSKSKKLGKKNREKDSFKIRENALPVSFENNLRLTLKKKRTSSQSPCEFSILSFFDSHNCAIGEAERKICLIKILPMGGDFYFFDFLISDVQR